MDTKVVTNGKKWLDAGKKDIWNTPEFIAQRIARLRKSLGLTQREFAKGIGVNPSYLSRVESGAQRIGMKTLEAICKRFSVDLSYFLITEAEKKILEKASHSTELEEFVEEVYQLPPEEQKTILDFLHLFTRRKKG